MSRTVVLCCAFFLLPPSNTPLQIARFALYLLLHRRKRDCRSLMHVVSLWLASTCPVQKLCLLYPGDGGTWVTPCGVRWERGAQTPIWRQELRELSLLGGKKIWLGQLLGFCLFVCLLVCLWCVTILFFLAVVRTLHSLLMRVSFMEKVAMYVKTEKDSAFSLRSPPTCKGEVKDFVTSFSLSQISRLLAEVVAKFPVFRLARKDAFVRQLW